MGPRWELLPVPSPGKEQRETLKYVAGALGHSFHACPTAWTQAPWLSPQTHPDARSHVSQGNPPAQAQDGSPHPGLGRHLFFVGAATPGVQACSGHCAELVTALGVFLRLPRAGAVDLGTE